MLRALILADDLSGAADCGVAFTKAGLRTLISLGDATEATDAEVLSVDANTRGLHPEAASAAIRRLVLHFAAEKEILLFKKIDSTLRGHVGIELAAALQEYRSLQSGSPPPIAVVAPAFPSIGRTTVHGTQWLHGVPLHQTDLWRMHGLTHAAHIPDILHAVCLRSVMVPLRLVRSAGSALRDGMSAAANQADVLVCDAESEQDLQSIASASLQLGRKVLLVGSAGLAHHVPRAVGQHRVPEATTVSLAPVGGPILFVIASLSHRSKEQVDTLTSSAPVQHLAVPPVTLLAGEGSADWEEYARQLERAVARGQDVVLGAGWDLQTAVNDRPKLTAALARLTAPVSQKAGALVSAGGETARSVLQCWGVRGLRLLGEVETGVPVSVTEGWTRRMPVITKAGDFGKPESLFACRTFLRQGGQR